MLLARLSRPGGVLLPGVWPDAPPLPIRVMVVATAPRETGAAACRWIPPLGKICVGLLQGRGSFLVVRDAPPMPRFVLAGVLRPAGAIGPALVRRLIRGLALPMAMAGKSRRGGMRIVAG